VTTSIERSTRESASAHLLIDFVAAQADSQPQGIAVSYGDKNGGAGTIAPSDVSIANTYQTSDTIGVSKAQGAEGLFGKVLGVFSVTVHAHATALVGPPEDAQYVAPIAVRITHPDLTGAACGQQNITDPSQRICFGPTNQTSLPLGKTGAPGAFDLINLDVDQQNGTVGASTLASWITKGYDSYLPLGVYFSDPGAKWNNSTIQGAMQARYGTDLLFPVYDQLINQGSNAEYHIIGWASFHLTNAYADGTSGTLTGYFTQVIWTGLLDQSGPSNPNIPDLGVHSVALID